METYIVRVYHRNERDPKRISGHVVKLVVKGRRDFFDSEMLRDILFPPTPGTPPEGLPRSGNGERMSMVELIRAIAEEENV